MAFNLVVLTGRLTADPELKASEHIQLRKWVERIFSRTP